MTDKKHTLLIIAKPSLLDEAGAKRNIFDRIISEGNTSLLMLRQKSLEEPNGVFDAVTSLS